MTYVFQHKKEENRIKMIEANSMDDAKTKLADRLYNRSLMINGKKINDSLLNYKLSCLM